jgi:PAS domain S-box-containing protein
MDSGLRKTGISLVGDMPWGTHFCTFYQTKQDLLDILVPYFKTGLESQEFCLWIISNSELITPEEAKEALGEAVPRLDQYLAEGRIEIVSHDDWFLENGAFDFRRVAYGFKEKLDQALAKGYAGLRINGSPAWIQAEDPNVLREFEGEADHFFADEHIIASCSYPVVESQADFLLDVARNHQFAIARRQGSWDVLETPQLIQAKQEIQRLNEQLEQRVIERTSELARANEELQREIVQRQQAEDRIRLIIDTIPMMAWSVRPDGTLDFVNQRWLNYTGLSFEEAIAEPTRTVHPEDLSKSIEKWLAVNATSEAYEDEMRLRRADGEYHWFLIRITPVLDEQGNVVMRYGVSVDIEERNQADDALRNQTEILQKIVDHIPVMINFTDRDGRVKLVNREWEKTMGWSLEEIRNANIDVFAQAYPDAKDRRAVMDFLRAASGEWADFKTWTRNGSVIDTSWARVRLSDGTTIGIGQDITERKRAEEALREAHQKYRDIFENAGEGIFQSTPDGKYIEANPALARMYGFASPAELIRSRADISREVYVDPTRREEFKRELEELGAVRGFEHEVFRKDGSMLWISVNARAVRDQQGAIRYYEGTAQDINERKAAEDRLRATAQQLRALSASLQSAREDEGTRIAREIHDELGSALTSLRWDLESFDKIISESGGRSELSTLREKIEGMLSLTESAVGTVRRISSELRPKVLDDLGLAAAIEWQAEQFQTRTGIVCHCDCSLENLNLDREQSTAVFRIFKEALTNILRHAQATNVEIAITAEAGEFILTVSDNGRGITEDERTDSRSLGILGMRERANLVNGEIAIWGTEGKGTVITVRVPMAG